MLQIDSRQVKIGDIFVAIKGEKIDGHDFICDAIKNGASKIIAEKGEYPLPYEIVDDTKIYLENYLKEKYLDKINKLVLIGMTGTNGKTTTCNLIYQALLKAGIKAAYIGTLGFYIDKEKRQLDNTTPSIYTLYNLLNECYERNCKYVVMEVSSQGLAYNRVSGLTFKYVIFSNLTQDHLDFHITMEEYMKAKQKLFKQTKDSIAIINKDDKYYNNFIFENNHNITYGTRDSDFKISNIDCALDKTEFKLNDEMFTTKLIGEYNVYNVSVVIILLKLLKIENINDLIYSLISPVGRMDIVAKNNKTVIVDYAHTPDAVLKILSTIRGVKHNKIITIIGCGGNRDKTKREKMGKIAVENSDYVIFTNDNPRFEKPRSIVKDIVKLLYTRNYKIILNRKRAIKKGIQMLKKNDILLVLGKGHENYQIIKDKVIPFDDKKIVLENL